MRCPSWLLVAALSLPAFAQTPAQMEYERQQREYWRVQEQQRQEQERQSQVARENARRQQEQSDQAVRARAGAPAAQQGVAADAPLAGGGAAGAQLEQARQAWLKRPPLQAANNPLLGAWTRPAAPGASNDPFAQLGALMKGGLCEVFFSGDAVFEFKPGALVGTDKRTRQAQTLDQVQYRGGGKQVVVIPETTLKLIVFDFDGPDSIRWAGQNCTLNRVGAGGVAKGR